MEEDGNELEDFDDAGLGVCFERVFEEVGQLLDATQADVDEVEEGVGCDGTAGGFVEDADFALGVEDEGEFGVC